MSGSYEFEPDYAVPPGETLKEVMQSLGMTQKELATRSDLTVMSLNRIFKGEQVISPSTAARLELVTGVPAGFWNNLEAQYQEQLAKIAEHKRLSEESQTTWIEDIPIDELVARGEIEDHEDEVLMLREALAFYGVSSIEAWQDIWETPAVAARRSPCFESHPGPASAWLRLGERQAQALETAPYDKAKFKDLLATIRELTVKEPEESIPEMRNLCADAGVAVALVPEFKNVPWSGATKWLTKDKVMILLNLRGKAEDKFWFSFFHEAGHVLHDNKTDLLINDGSADDPREVRANQFAANVLIPEHCNDRIRKVRSGTQLVAIARELGIAPGIVAGRYQFVTKKWQFHKKLIRSLNWD